MYIVRIVGNLNVGGDVIIRFYPSIKAFLDSIRSKGWKYSFKDVTGKARVILDLDRVNFDLKYYPPSIEEFEEKGKYVVEATIGDKPPSIVKVESIDSFKISISTEHAWSCVSIDPINKVITYIEDVLWGGIRLKGERGPEKLSEAREVYDVVKFLLSNGYKFKDKYVIENYKTLIDLFEKKYSFTLTIELTVDNEEKVPSWKELESELSEFFYERGLLMKLKKNSDRDIFSIFRKPLP